MWFVPRWTIALPLLDFTRAISACAGNAANAVNDIRKSDFATIAPLPLIG
jgi:hypothetical protein